jgi:hypothetical protein
MRIIRRSASAAPFEDTLLAELLRGEVVEMEVRADTQVHHRPPIGALT